MTYSVPEERRRDEYNRAFFADREVPPADEAFAHWRGRLTHPGAFCNRGDARRAHEKPGGGLCCVGGWIPSGNWWLHCPVCRPQQEDDVAPEERLSAERLDLIRQAMTLRATLGPPATDAPLRRAGHDGLALLAHIDALRATIEDLTAERDAARERGAAYKREAAAWSKGVGEFVDEFAPTYCAEAACGPADLLPALPEIAERIRDRVRRAAADTPKLQAAQAWVDARRERDRLLSMVRNKRTRREFFRGAEALDVAEEALAAAFTEEPEGPQPEAPSEWQGFMAAGTQEFHRATCRLCLSGQHCEATDD